MLTEGRYGSVGWSDGWLVIRKGLVHFNSVVRYLRTRVNIYKRTNVIQLGSMFICNCNIALHVSDAFCVHLQEHLETVEAASGE